MEEKRHKRRYNDEIKEQAYMMNLCGNTIKYISKELNVPRKTVEGWVKQKRESAPDEFESRRREIVGGFVEKTGVIIDKGLLLIDKRFDKALKDSEEFDKVIDVLLKADAEGGELNIKAAAETLSKAYFPALKDITTAVGTLYDKRALATGKPTEHMEITAEDKELFQSVQRIYEQVGGGKNERAED